MKHKSLATIGLILIIISTIFILNALIQPQTKVTVGPVEISHISEQSVIQLIIFSLILLGGIGLLVKGLI
ncbi:MAG TPA: hypothetical protein VH415_11210 [Nitrososphaeraceae archaeon]